MGRSSSVQRALVSGASRGLGLAIARGLVEQGYEVLGTSRNAAGDRAIADIGAESVRLDVTSTASIESLQTSLEDGLDALVNNAGVSLEGFDVEVVRRTLEVNVYGPMRLTDALLPRIRPHGRIVMVSSGMGALEAFGQDLQRRFLDPGLERETLIDLMESFAAAVEAGNHVELGWPSSAYRVSKAGLGALVRVLQRELEGDARALLVNAACPGWVRTDMGGTHAPRSPEEGADTPIWLATLPKDGPSGQWFRDRRPIDW